VPASAYAQGQAQSQTKWGITFQTPTSVGVIWQANERVAIRPDMRVSHSSLDSSTTTTVGSVSVTNSSQSSSYSLAAGIAGLFYVTKWDNLRSYLSPRFDYAYSHSRTSSSNATPGLTTSSTSSVSGSLGVQFDAHRHLSAFGELGATYGWSGTPTTTGGQPSGLPASNISSTLSSHTLGVRVAFGAIVFF
jgi:hypothetical protein